MVGRIKNLTIQQLQSNLQNQFDRVQENLGVTGDQLFHFIDVNHFMKLSL